MILNFTELWKPYARDGNALENSIRYLRKTASLQGISPYLVDMAVEAIFIKVAEGKTFPHDHCPCGCGIDKAGTAITHAMRDYMFNLDKENRLAEAQYIETKLNRTTLNKASETMDEAFAALKDPPKKPGIFKRIKNELFRNRIARSISNTDTE